MSYGVKPEEPEVLDQKEIAKDLTERPGIGQADLRGQRSAGHQGKHRADGDDAPRPNGGHRRSWKPRDGSKQRYGGDEVDREPHVRELQEGLDVGAEAARLARGEHSRSRNDVAEEAEVGEVGEHDQRAKDCDAPGGPGPDTARQPHNRQWTERRHRQRDPSVTGRGGHLGFLEQTPLLRPERQRAPDQIAQPQQRQKRRMDVPVATPGIAEAQQPEQDGRQRGEHVEAGVERWDDHDDVNGGRAWVAYGEPGDVLLHHVPLQTIDADFCRPEQTCLEIDGTSRGDSFRKIGSGPVSFDRPSEPRKPVVRHMEPQLGIPCVAAVIANCEWNADLRAGCEHERQLRARNREGVSAAQGWLGRQDGSERHHDHPGGERKTGQS